jgi:hypothetical protein
MARTYKIIDGQIKIKKGVTLKELADELGVSVAVLREANPQWKDNNKLANGAFVEQAEVRLKTPGLNLEGLGLQQPAGQQNVTDVTDTTTPTDTTAPEPTAQELLQQLLDQQAQTTAVVDTTPAKSAKDVVLELFRNAGMDDTFVNQLAGVIDQVYQDNIVPTQEQVLSTIYNSDVYKKRFSGNELIRKRMADGQGLPGDRILNPAEYLDLERQYRDIFSEAGLPAGFWDTPDDFSNLIGSGISAAEVNARVGIAADALNYADSNTLGALQTYYGLSRGDMVAYLLDPTKAMNVLQSKTNTTANLQFMYTSSQVGGAASRQGLAATQQFSEEITKAGKADVAEQAFAAASEAQGGYERLANIYGQTAGQEDLARAALQLEGGVTAKQKIKTLAQKERAAFSTQSALTESSLTRRTDV